MGGSSATLNAGMLIGPLVGGVVAQATSFGVAFAITVVMEVIAIVLVAGRVREPVAHEQGGAGTAPSSWRALISLPLVGAYAAFFAQQTVMGILAALWAIWLHDLGGSYTYIGMTMTVFALPQIFLGALAGRLGDRWGRAPLLLGGGLLVSVVYALRLHDQPDADRRGGDGRRRLHRVPAPAAQSLLADGSPPRRADARRASPARQARLAARWRRLPRCRSTTSRARCRSSSAGIAMTAGSVVAAVGAVTWHAVAGAAVPASRVAAR